MPTEDRGRSEHGEVTGDPASFPHGVRGAGAHARCAAAKRDGRPCGCPAQPGRRYCFNHDPARAEERTENARLGATLKGSKRERALLRALGDEGERGPTAAEYAAAWRRVEAHLLLEGGCLVYEDELALLPEPYGEEGHEADLRVLRAYEGLLPADVARRKRLSNARRLVRLLDERDPEQDVEGGGEAELLAELVPLMEGRGYDAGDAREALGG